MVVLTEENTPMKEVMKEADSLRNLNESNGPAEPEFKIESPKEEIKEENLKQEN